MRTRTFAAHSPLQPLKGVKRAIALAKHIGTFYQNTRICFATPSHRWTYLLTPSTWTIHSTLQRLRRSPALISLMKIHLDDAFLAVLRLFGLINTPHKFFFFFPPCLPHLLERRRCRRGFSADAPVNTLSFHSDVTRVPRHSFLGHLERFLSAVTDRRRRQMRHRHGAAIA